MSRPVDDEDFDPGPYVCPGCHAVGDEPCSVGCIDAEIARDRKDAPIAHVDDCDCDDCLNDSR